MKVVVKNEEGRYLSRVRGEIAFVAATASRSIATTPGGYGGQTLT